MKELLHKRTFLMICTGDEQNNRNTIPTVHVSLVIWCWTTFCNQYSLSFLKRTSTSFKQFLAECYIIILEVHLQVVSEMLEVGICSFSSLQNWPEWFNTIKIQWMGWPDVEVHLLAFQTTIAEQFQLWKLGHCCLGKLCCHSDITSGSWDTSDYPTCLHPPLQ